MAEKKIKKKPVAKTAAKKKAEKKPAKKTSATAKKAPAKKAPAKASAKKPKRKKRGVGDTAVRTAKAESRADQEDGSIAPPTARLVDAFAKYRRAAKTRRPGSGQTPAVARLPAGGSLPTPPKPAPAKPEEPPKPEAAPPAAPPPAPAQPPAPSPAQPAARTAPPPEAPEKPADPPPKPEAPPPPKAPEPKATYTLPAEPTRPMAPPSRFAGPRPKAPGRRSSAKAKPAPAPAPKPEAPKPKEAAELKPLKVSTIVTVRELAEKMLVHPNDLIKKLMSQGVFATINQRLDSETAILVAGDYGYELEVVPLHMEEEIAGVEKVEDKPEDLQPRSPVVTVMGHVDHGKTKLLDAIREANVVDGEAGGITQHIGAYRVRSEKGRIIFLDTPGHAAFTAMRSRGAKVTDIVVLVVSAVDGVMPQTVEAIDHAKEAQVPIVVAVNKIDLPAANPQKIRQDLAQRGLLPEEWGGKTIYVDISAKKRQNIDKLLEMILLQAEMLELKANPDRPAVGAVVEAKLDKKRGNVATVLIQNGTVKVGDPFVMGLAGGKVRGIIDETGERRKTAGPATPVEILGISGATPQAGDTFSVVEDERMSRDITAKRNRVYREEALAHKQHVSLLNVKSTRVKDLAVILKADVQGSIEVLKDSLEKLSTEETRVRVIHSALGNANETDVLLATASDAIIFLFHVGIEPRAKEVAEKEGVEVRSYDVIYDLTADVQAALEGLLEPEVVEVPVGKVEIRAEFKIRGTKVAGSYVTEGKAVRGARVRVLRAEDEVGRAKIETLKHFKDDKREVEKGLECGIALGGFSEWQVGDILEVLVVEKRVRRLEPSQ